MEAPLSILNLTDYKQNRVINIVLDPRATNPTNGKQGQIYTNTTDNKLYTYTGTQWIAVGGITDIISENSTIAIEIIDGVANLLVNVDNTTIENAVNGQLQVKDAGITTSKLANDSVTTIKITDKNVTFQKFQDIPTMTVIGNITSSTGTADAISIINDNDLTGASGSNLATAGAIKAYVDALFVDLGSLQGSFDAANETQLPGDSTTVKGDYWYVTSDGTVAGRELAIGDVVIANVPNPNPNDPNDYIFLATNRGQATETTLGVVRLATIAEVQAGTDENKVITPAGLSARTATETRTGIARLATNAEALAGTNDTTIMTPAKVKALIDSYDENSFSATIGNGTDTTYTITHGLDSQNVIAEIFETSTNMKVLAPYAPISNAVVEVYFSVAPTLNEFRIVIKD